MWGVQISCGKKVMKLDNQPSRKMKFLNVVRSLLTLSQIDMAWRRTALMLLAQILSLLAFLLIAFHDNRPYLLHGLDGAYMKIIAKQQHIWTHMSFGLTNNLFQSLGTVWFPLNTQLIPGYALSLLLNGGEVAPAVSYVIFSLGLFVAVFILSISLRQDWLVSAMAAWGLTLSVMPVFGKGVVYPVFDLVPHGATSIAWTLIAIVLFASAGRRSVGWTAMCACSALLILVYLLTAQPAFMVLAAPAMVIFGAFLTLGAENKSERNVKIVVGALLIVAAFILGLPQFMDGLLKYTAVYFRASEFANNRMTMQFASIAFHGAIHGIAGPILFGLGIGGSLLVAFAGSGKVRVVAFGVLFYAAALLITGTVTAYTDIWHGPSPLYFEFFLWPFYAVYSAILLRFMWAVVAGAVWPRMFRDSSHFLSVNRPSVAFLLSACFAMIPWLLFMVNFKTPNLSDFRYPPKVTPITALLKEEIGLTPGGVFRGRVATLTGMRLPNAITWTDLHILDFTFDQKFGNEHRTIGLWYFDIPTLFEYSSIMTPPFYVVSRTFFARPEDKQTRNVLVLRRFEPRILRSMGVRFIITDAPLSEGARLRLILPDRDIPLYLYEIDDVNVGDFSPTQHRVSSDASEILAELAKPGFDPRRRVLSDIPLPGQGALSQASSGKLIVKSGQLHISAKSASRSVLLLPLEYSHCLEIRSTEAPGASLPKLFRANLLQAGILFEDRLDADITYFTGPFHNANCRREDARDMERMNIREAPSSIATVRTEAN